MNEKVSTSKRIKMEYFENWSSTLIKVVRLRHTWTINNFSFSSESNGQKLESPYFSSGPNSNKSEWRLELYPNGKDKDNTDGISLFLVLVECYLFGINIKYKLGIVHPKGQDMNIFKSSIRLEENQTWGCEKFIMKDSLLNKKNEVLLDDKLTVFCEISAPVGIENISGTLTTPAPQNHLANDFAFLLENKDLSDVTLSTGGKEFPAHKVILAARSPVFKAMFQHDMVESKNNRVEITDIDDEGLSEMLRYMYTGEIHKLKQMAPRLLGMAEKYELDGLKITCEKALFESLSLENAAETFILSDTFRATDLKDHVKNFIVAHASDVGKTPGFESMVRTHPHLGVEAFCILSNSSVV